MGAYSTVLLIHSWLRWFVVLAAIVALALFVTGGKQPWRRSENILSRVFISLVDVQILIGLVLYIFLSPMSRALFENPGASMKVSVLRYFGVEHIFGMIVAAAIVHVASVKAKRRPTDEARRKTIGIGTAVWLAIVLITMPWPGMPYARPLFRTSSLTVPSQQPAPARSASPRDLVRTGSTA